MDVEFTTKADGSPWVIVKLKRSQWFQPSFEDLHRIIRAICECEDKKYPPPAEGRDFVTRILMAMPYTESWDELARDFKIPIREGNQIVKTNGANLKK